MFNIYTTQNSTFTSTRDISMMNKSIIYLLEKINQFDFYNLLYLQFPLFSKGVIQLPLDASIKISVSLIYKFDIFSPDFNVEIIEDGVVLHSEQSSIGSRPNEYNHLKFDVIIKPHDSDKLRVRLYKVDNTTNKILLNKLSHIQITMFQP